jgi:hypothetical protein
VGLDIICKLWNGSAYYVAYSLLEMLLSSFSALLMGCICYPLMVRATRADNSLMGHELTYASAPPI